MRNARREFVRSLAPDYAVSGVGWLGAFAVAYKATRRQPGSLWKSSNAFRWVRLRMLEATVGAMLLAMVVLLVALLAPPFSIAQLPLILIFWSPLVTTVLLAGEAIYPALYATPLGCSSVAFSDGKTFLMTVRSVSMPDDIHRGTIEIKNLIAVQRGSRSARPLIDLLLARADQRGVCVQGVAQNEELMKKYYIPQLGFEHDGGRSIVRRPQSSLPEE